MSKQSAATTNKHVAGGAGQYQPYEPETEENGGAGVVDRAAETVRGAGEAAWQATERAGSQARDYARDAYGQAYREGERGVRYVAHQIEAQPLVSILLAGAIGYLAAYTIHARR
jgi:hypothetical protein